MLSPTADAAMQILNRLAVLVAVLISAGEVARFWGDPRFFPMAFDELLVAAALIWARWRAPQYGALGHLAAWSAFAGLVLVLLIETATHQIHGPVKSAGTFYLGALSALLALGLWAIRRSWQVLAAGDRREIDLL